MLRYGIPAYRFPREKLDVEISSILSTGVEVHTGVTVGKDISFEQLHKDYDCLYVAIGAHTDKKTGIAGENSKNVMSAVEMLRAIGDDVMPDFTGQARRGHRRRQRCDGRDKKLCPSGRFERHLRLSPQNRGYDRASGRGEGRDRRRCRGSRALRAGAHRGKRSRRSKQPSGSSRRSSALPTRPAARVRRLPISPKNASRQISSLWQSVRVLKLQALNRPVSPSAEEPSWQKAPARSTTWKPSLQAATA